MDIYGLLQIVLLLLSVLLTTKPLGTYLYRVFETPAPPLGGFFGPLERIIYRIAGADPGKEQNWREYAVSLLLFSAVSIAVSFAIFMAQGLLPLNDKGMGGMGADLAFNAAVSFVTNTNWQSYAGEAAVTNLTQMLILTWQNFVSAAAGIGAALALCRGLTRRQADGASDALGNFWVDLVRGCLYVFLPFCIIYTLVLVSQGVVQTLASQVAVTGVEGSVQNIALGPVASQEAIKMFGTNGGGFFNANSAHPFENPTPLTNFLQMFSIFVIPAALTYTFGLMAGDKKQGWVLFASMMVLFVAGTTALYRAEAGPNPALSGIETSGAGNMEGKEVRFGIASSSLFAAITTSASCGAVNSMHDSFTPLGGLVPLTNILLGEVIFGGVGAGLYGMLIFVLLAVFIAGLMVGRTPEYLGKKIEAREIKLTVLYILIFPMFVLGFAAVSSVTAMGISSLSNHGPHGISQILYAYASATGNNGSAFAGLNANTTWWNLSMAAAMLAGRFGMILPVLALAGSMAPKRIVPTTSGTFPTGGATFVFLLLGVIVIVGALTFFPALTLGPVLEHFLAGEGRLF
ncbi:potassium-transporting ATPase subunit KdpA [bacterium]|nr:MAG: potassium-transporting ATPase subunit KdpA [bacterium]